MAEVKINPNNTIGIGELFRTPDKSPRVTTPAPAPKKEPMVQAQAEVKTYVIYISNEDQDADHYKRIEARMTRDEAVTVIIAEIENLNDVSIFGSLNSTDMYNVLNEGELYCSGEDNKFARISILNFLTMMKDVAKISEEDKGLLKEFLELAEEGAQYAEDDDENYDINDCKDVLKEEE